MAREREADTDVVMLTAPEVARRLGIGRATLYRLLVDDPTFPRGVAIRTARRWRVATVDRWLDEREAAEQGFRT